MDLWRYIIIDEERKEIDLSGELGSGGSPGYSNDNIVNGKIKGTVPQYIKIDGISEIYTVTGMQNTFFKDTNLIEAPVIPNTVTKMGNEYIAGTFYKCSNLTISPKIPNGVTSMFYTFSGCSSLTTAPTIPSGVTDMDSTFYGCSSLKIAPEIPDSVTSMDYTFSGCSSLTTVPKISSSVTSMFYTFSDCSSLTTAPQIPSSVTNMDNTFSQCINLTGIIKINARNVTENWTFGGVSKPLIIQVPAGSTTYTNFTESYADSSNITIQTF